MFPIVEPHQRPERFTLNRFSPLAESAAFLGLGGFDAAGSVWYPDARRLLGGVPNDGKLTNMDPATDWVRSPELGRWATDYSTAASEYASVPIDLDAYPVLSLTFWGNTTAGSRIAFGHGSYVHGLLHYNNAWHWQYNDGTNYLTKWAYVLPAGWHAYGIIIADKTSAPIMYADGSLITAEAGTNTVNTGSDTLRIGGRGTTNGWGGSLSDFTIHSRLLSPAEISALADPSNVMLEVGGVPLILPPPRESFPTAVAEPVLTYRNYILGGGVF